MEALKQLGSYADAELSAAVVSSFISVFIKTEAEIPTSGRTSSAGDGRKGRRQGHEARPAAMIDLAPGEEIQSFDPKRPNTAFDPFVLAILRQIGVALEIPFEILVKHFTASYSAARAAPARGLEVLYGAAHLARDELQPADLRSVALRGCGPGRVPAPGFFADPSSARHTPAPNGSGPHAA